MKKIFSGSTLKIVAMFFMVIDHLGQHNRVSYKRSGENFYDFHYCFFAICHAIWYHVPY